MSNSALFFCTSLLVFPNLKAGNCARGCISLLCQNGAARRIFSRQERISLGQTHQYGDSLEILNNVFGVQIWNKKIGPLFTCILLMMKDTAAFRVASASTFSGVGFIPRLWNALSAASICAIEHRHPPRTHDMLAQKISKETKGVVSPSTWHKAQEQERHEYRLMLLIPPAPLGDVKGNQYFWEYSHRRNIKQKLYLNMNKLIRTLSSCLTKTKKITSFFISLGSSFTTTLFQDTHTCPSSRLEPVSKTRI